MKTTLWTAPSHAAGPEQTKLKINKNPGRISGQNY